MGWWIRGVRIAQILWMFYEAFYLIILVNANGCKDMVFKVTMEGKALANHVFKTIPAVINDGNCESMCFQDDRCISYNFGTSASGEKYMCELSESDHIMHPEHLVNRRGTIYRSAENTCSCLKNTTCRFNFVDGTHRCECKPGFVGENCAEFNPCASAPCLNGGKCRDIDRSLDQKGYACNCSEGYAGVNCENGVYSSETLFSWNAALQACKEKSMNLPSIHSDEENERIRNLTRGPLVWIGLRLKTNRWFSFWTWSDGSWYDYRKGWGNYYNGGCVYMDKESGKWMASSCNKNLAAFYICATV